MSKVLQKQTAKANGGIKSGQFPGSSHGAATGSRAGRATAGTASSVSFTPVQGLEIVNPQATAAERIAEANAKYFGATSGFVQVKTGVDNRKAE